MRKVGIIGFGELGKQFKHYYEDFDADIRFIYFDDNAFSNNIINAFPFNCYLEEEFSDYEFIVCLGYKHLHTKLDIVESLISGGRKILTFVHKSAYIDRTAIIQPGVIIYPNVTIDKDVIIGCGSIINLSATISHNTFIGKCCFVAPNVTISGFVNIDKCVFIGASSTISNCIEVGAHSRIGIGSVITKDLPANSYAIGNPQRILESLNLF